MRKASAPLLAAWLAAGCVPAPRMVPTTPAFEGWVVRAGEPAGGVEVLLSTGARDDHCEEVERRTTSDADGRFELPPARRFSMFYAFVGLGDPLFSWHLCLAEGPTRHRGLSGGSLGVLPEGGAGACCDPSRPLPAPG